MTPPECRCHWAGEAFHCPVHHGEPATLPTYQEPPKERPLLVRLAEWLADGLRSKR